MCELEICQFANGKLYFVKRKFLILELAKISCRELHRPKGWIAESVAKSKSHKNTRLPVLLPKRCKAAIFTSRLIWHLIENDLVTLLLNSFKVGSLEKRKWWNLESEPEHLEYPEFLEWPKILNLKKIKVN